MLRILGFLSFLLSLLAFSYNAGSQCLPRTTARTICAGEPASLAIDGMDTVTRYTLIGHNNPNTTPIGNVRTIWNIPDLQATTTMWSIRQAGTPCPQQLTTFGIRVGQPARLPNTNTCVAPGTNGLIAHYDFTTGLIDLSGNGHHLQNGGYSGSRATTATIDHRLRPNGARYFDGSASLSTPATSLINSPSATNQYTMALWIRVDSWVQTYGAEQFSAGMGRATTSQTAFSYRIYPFSNGITVSSNGWNHGGNFTNQIVLGQWVHLAAIYTGNAILLYMNGEKTAEIRTPPIRLYTGQEPLILGYDPTGALKTLQGAMANVYLYNRALSTDEVRYLANDGNCSPLTVSLVPVRGCKGTMSYSLNNTQPGIAYYFQDSLGRRIGDTISTRMFTPRRIIRSLSIPRGTKWLKLAGTNWGCTTVFPERYQIPDSIFNDILPPIQLINPNGGPVCQGAPVQLFMPDSSFGRPRWSTGQLAQRITVTQPGRYWATVTSPAGCTDTVYYNLVFQPSARPLELPGTTTICPSSPHVPLTNVGPGWNVTYRVVNPSSQFTFIPPLPGSNMVSFTFPPGNTGSLDVTLERTAVSTTNGCIYLDTTYVRILPGPENVRILGDTAYCYSGFINLSAQATSSWNVPYRYRWSTGDTTSSIRVAIPPDSSSLQISVLVFGISCSATTSQVVRFLRAVPADAGNSTMVCWGSPFVLGTNSPGPRNKYRWSPVGNTGPVTLSNTLIPNPVLTWQGISPDTLTIIRFRQQAVDTTNGCVSDDTIAITVNPPSRSNAGADVAICEGQQITIGPSSPILGRPRVQWGPVGYLDNDTILNPRVIFAPGRDTAYQIPFVLTTLNLLGCVSQDTMLLTVNPKPRFTITGPTSVCPGIQNVGYKLSPATSGNVTWLTDVATIGSGQGRDSVNLNWPNIRQSAVRIMAIATSSDGCLGDTATLFVRVLPRLTPPMPLGEIESCLNDSIKVYSTPPATGSQYTWTVQGGQVISGQGTNSVRVRWSGSGNHSISFREQTIADTICEGTSPSLNVLLLPTPPRPTISPVASRCGAGSFDLQATGTTGATLEWQSPPGVQLISGQNTGNARFAAAPGQHTIKVRQRSALGCLSLADSIVYTVNPLPTVLAGADTNLCLNELIQLGTAGQTGIQYTWDQPALLSDVSLAQPVFRPTSTGRFTLVLTGQNTVTGCINRDTVVVRVDSLPYRSATANGSSVCQGETIVLATASQATNQTYRWAPVVGLTNLTSENPQFMLPNRLLRDSVYRFIRTTRVMASPGSGSCEVQDTVRIRVVARPNLADVFRQPYSTCAGNNLSPSHVVSNQLSYKWTAPLHFSSQDLAAGSDTLAIPVFNWPRSINLDSVLRDTILTVRLEVKHKITGCRDSINVPIRYTPGIKKLTGGVQQVCYSGPVNYAVGRPAQAGIVYRWQGVIVTDTVLAQPRIFLDLGNDTKDSTFVFSVRALNPVTGCERTETDSIVVLYPPMVATTMADTVCEGSSVTFEVEYPFGYQTSTNTWFLDGVQVGTGNAFTVNYPTGMANTQPRTYVVRTARTALPSCYQENRVLLWFQPSVELSLANADPWLCPDRLIRRYRTATYDSLLIYRWQATQGTILAQDSNWVEVSWLPGLLDYQLTVSATTWSGCVVPPVTRDITVDMTLTSPLCDVKDYPLEVPNVITPNGDGTNDVFDIRNAIYYPGLVLNVWNRYGTPVFTGSVSSTPWRASDLAAGTYFYKLDTGRGQVLKGWLEVMR